VTTRVTFTANVSGGTPPHTYIWKKAGQVITGATSSTWTIPSLNLSDQAEYTVEVRDASQNIATSPETKLFVWTVVNVDFKPLGIAMKGTVQFATAPEIDQVRVLDVKTGDRLGPVQLPAGSKPTGVTVGSDGNIWVTLFGTSEVARIAPQTLQVNRWVVGEKPYGIASAGNGEIWFTLQGQGKIGKLPAGGGSPTLYNASASSTPVGLMVASDGTVWFTEQDPVQGRVGRIRPGSSQVEEWVCAHSNAKPEEILVTPGGKVYYNDKANAAVVSFTVTDQAQGSAPLNEDQVKSLQTAQVQERMNRRRGKGAGSNLRTAGMGAVLQQATPEITAAAVVNQGSLNRAFAYGVDPQGGPAGIAMDGSGNVWLTQQEIGKVTRLAMDGSTYTHTLPSIQSKPSGITVGSGGDVWVTMSGTNQMAQVPPAPPVITVKINRNEPVRALKGETIAFSSTVTGTNNSSVTWSIQDGVAGGGITPSGTWTAPTTPGLVNIIATSVEDPSKYGRIVVQVYPWTAWPKGQLLLTAGNVQGAGNMDGVSNSARFYLPTAVTGDRNGNLYLADAGNYTIRKITPTGLVTTFAGSPGQSGSADGVGSAARFGVPYGITIDVDGNLYVSDPGNFTIRKVTLNAEVTTLAGSPGKYGHVNGTASTVRLGNMRGIAVDKFGNLFVAENIDQTIRKISSSGEVTTLAGDFYQGGSTDGTGINARFSTPLGITVDGDGTVYVTDNNNYTIRKIAPSGVVTTLAGGPGQRGHVDGAGGAARFEDLVGITSDVTGNLYVTDSCSVRKITPGGVVTTLGGIGIGSVDGNINVASFSQPEGIVATENGHLYLADTGNSTVRKITIDGDVTTMAGSPLQLGMADGVGSAAQFFNPVGVTSDKSGNLYVADQNNQTIRKITPNGEVSTLAGSPRLSGFANGTGSAARFSCPNGVIADVFGNIYVTDLFNHVIRKITPAGVVTTLAGSPGQSGYADGLGSSALFALPWGITSDTSGNLYVADHDNHVIRKITPSGEVTTFAGSPGQQGDSDGVGSTARFSYPYSITTDGNGNVYVVDWFNFVVRKITSSGVVTTLAGNPRQSGYGDGVSGTARFAEPITNHEGQIVAGAGGILFKTEGYGNTLRMITPDGFVGTILGDVTCGVNRSGLLRDGVDLPLPYSYGAMAFPRGITVAPDGSLFITAANGVMKVTFTP
jgi:streptogramin lyase